MPRIAVGFRYEIRGNFTGAVKAGTEKYGESKMEIEHLRGLIAAPHTPFDRNGMVAYPVIRQQAELLLEQGVTGAYVSGTTGEGVSCSVEERLKVMDAWSEASAGRLKLIVHIGALSIRDVETLGRHANELRVHATSVVPPNYFKPASLASLVRFCALAAATAPDTAFYYYHTVMSGVTFPMDRFLEAADGVIPNLAGIKFNSPDLYMYQNCRHACGGRYDIVYGVDEFFAGALALGAECFIGSTYNYMAPTYLEVWEAFRRGDMAGVDRGMRKACLGVDILVKHGGVAAGKAMMLAHGVDCGDPRPPLDSLDDAAKQRIVEEFRRIIAR